MKAAPIQLKTDLKKFGLNPADWNVQKIKAQKYKIAHIKDRSFYFIGETLQIDLAPQWTQIQLASF